MAMTMKIFSLEERCCSTCDNLQGGRVIGECCYIYTLEEMPGQCLISRTYTGVSNSCASWVLWRVAIGEVLRKQVRHHIDAKKIGNLRINT